MALFPMTNAGAAFTLDGPQTVDQYFQGIRTKADFSAAFATLSEGVEYSNGLRLLASGQLSIVDASSGLPASATFVNGLPITSDGKLCVSKNAIATWSNGIAFDAAGAVVFNPFAGASLDLNFAEATALDSRVTFTRASNATFFDSAGVLQSAANNVPRLDYDPVTFAARGLLIEEQRTNSIRNNTMVGAVAGTPGTLPTNWIATSTGGSITRTVVGAGTENGINYIDIRYQFSGAANAQIITEATNQIAASSGQNWASSFYVKLVGGSLTNIAATLNLQELNAGGAVLATTVTAFTPTSNGLATQRYSNTRNLNQATCAFVVQYILLAASGAANITLRIGLPQLEQGAFATSVIPTTTAAATRAADIATMTGTNFSSWFNAAAGTLFAEWNAFGSNYNRSVVDIEQTAAATDRIDIAINSSNVINPKTVVGGSAVASLNGGNYTANTTARLAFAYASANYASSLNGAAAVTATTAGALPSSLAKMFIGSLSGISGQQINGHIRRITYYPRRLSNAELQWITS